MATFKFSQGVSQSSVNAAVNGVHVSGKAKPGRTIDLPDFVEGRTLAALYRIGRFIGSPAKAAGTRKTASTSA